MRLTPTCTKPTKPPTKTKPNTMNIPKYTQSFRNELTLKNYSFNTIKNYVSQVEYFLKHHQDKFTEPAKINETTIKKWLLQFKTRNAMCHAISAIKLFYIAVIKQPKKFEYIQYPRSEKTLPIIIEKQFLLDQITKIENIKHKAIIMLAYSTGMRV